MRSVGTGRACRVSGPLVGLISTWPPSLIAARARCAEEHLPRDRRRATLPTGVCRTGSSPDVMRRVSMSDGPDEMVRGRIERHVLTEGHPVHLLVTVDELAIGRDRDLRVVEPVAVALDHSYRHGRAEPLRERTQLRRPPVSVTGPSMSTTSSGHSPRGRPAPGSYRLRAVPVEHRAGRRCRRRGCPAGHRLVRPRTDRARPGSRGRSADRRPRTSNTTSANGTAARRRICAAKQRGERDPQGDETRSSSNGRRRARRRPTVRRPARWRAATPAHRRTATTPPRLRQTHAPGSASIAPACRLGTRRTPARHELAESPRRSPSPVL